MIFNNVKNKCVLAVLKILDKKEARYNYLFKETKVSHTTLQKVLRGLEERKFISREEIYKITKKGKEFLKKLEELKDYLV